MILTRLVGLGLVVIGLAACGGNSAPGEGSPKPAGAAEAGAEAGAGYDLQALLAEADAERGRTLFLQCRACHSLGQGEPHKVGPNLHGLFGKAAGVAPGFAFSEPLADSGIVWSAETLDPWLERPSEMVPGNKMVFIGIRDPADRADLIAYLRQATGEP